MAENWPQAFQECLGDWNPFLIVVMRNDSLPAVAELGREGLSDVMQERGQHKHQAAVAGDSFLLTNPRHCIHHMARVIEDVPFRVGLTVLFASNKLKKLRWKSLFFQQFSQVFTWRF